MKSTGRWVQVLRDKSDRNPTTRMLHVDRRGRECVRYERQWRLVEKISRPDRVTYVLGGML